MASNKYEIAITGSSRPSLYPIFWESFHKMVKMREKPKITVYEDVILRAESNEVKKFIKNKVDQYIEIDPYKKLGYVFNELLKNITCEYFVYLQEDWKFLREIDIDALVNIMDKTPNIKQIWFPKFLQDNVIRKFIDDNPIEIDGIWITPYFSWAFLPHIARTSFIKDIWSKGQVWKNERPETGFKRTVKNLEVIKKQGYASYILGRRNPHSIHRTTAVTIKGAHIKSRFIEYLEHLGLRNLQTKKLIMKAENRKR